MIIGFSLMDTFNAPPKSFVLFYAHAYLKLLPKDADGVH